MAWKEKLVEGVSLLFSLHVDLNFPTAINGVSTSGKRFEVVCSMVCLSPKENSLTQNSVTNIKGDVKLLSE